MHSENGTFLSDSISKRDGANADAAEMLPCSIEHKTASSSRPASGKASRAVEVKCGEAGTGATRSRHLAVSMARTHHLTGKSTGATLAQQLVAGFSGPPSLPESRREAGFSAAVPGSGRIQFSGGPEWREAVAGKRFPRNWISGCLNNLSCRTCPSAAVGRHRS